MLETIVKIQKPTQKGKKYSAIIKNNKTGKTRIINFGSSINDQYKDSTPLKIYSRFLLGYDQLARKVN